MKFYVTLTKGPLRCVEEVEASDAEDAKMKALLAVTPKTALAFRVHVGTGRMKWEAMEPVGPVCTVRFATTGICGKPAVWCDQEHGFAECEKHAADPGALARGIKSAVATIGDIVTVWRHGREYWATVTRVGARGAVYAEVIYKNGVKRTVRV